MYKKNNISYAKTNDVMHITTLVFNKIDVNIHYITLIFMKINVVQ